MSDELKFSDDTNAKRREFGVLENRSFSAVVLIDGERCLGFYTPNPDLEKDEQIQFGAWLSSAPEKHQAKIREFDSTWGNVPSFGFIMAVPFEAVQYIKEQPALCGRVAKQLTTDYADYM